MRRLGWKIVVVATLARVSAQSPPQEPSTFRVGTHLVEVDVVVRDKNGPVTGLTKADFTVFDCKGESTRQLTNTSWCKDKQQPIQLFRGSGESRTTTLVTRSAPPPGTVSNRIDNRGAAVGSATVLLLDQLNAAFDHKEYERSKIIQYLRTLRANDRIAIYSLGKSLHVLQDFTDDPQKLVDAVSKMDHGLDQMPLYAGDPSLYKPPPPIRTGDAVTDMLLAKADAQAEEPNPAIKDIYDQITLEALRKIVQHMSGVPGRKSLIWIKEFPNLPTGALPLLQENNIALYPVLIRSLRTSGVFNMGPRGRLGVPIGAEFALQNGVQDLGASTGGAGFGDAADIATAVSRAEEDAGSAYLLGFYPAENDLDGKLHTLNVAVSRKFARAGLQVSFRTQYLATAQAPAHDNGTLTDMFDSPLDATAIGLTAVATPDQTEAGVYHLDITVNLGDVQLRQQGDRWVGSLRMAMRRDLADATGVIAPVAPIVQTQPISLTQEQFQARFITGFVVRQRWTGVNAAAGSLRIVVLDQASGAAGSLRVPLRKGPEPRP
jgi:VWFA-related protein